MAKITPNSKAAKPTKPAKTEDSEGTPKRPAFKAQDASIKVAMPEGFNFESFKPLKTKAFESKAIAFEHQALFYEWKAKLLHAKATEERTYGDKTTRATAKRLDKGLEKMRELIDTLKSKNHDTSVFEAKLAEMAAALASAGQAEVQA